MGMEGGREGEGEGMSTSPDKHEYSGLVAPGACARGIPLLPDETTIHNISASYRFYPHTRPNTQLTTTIPSNRYTAHQESKRKTYIQEPRQKHHTPPLNSHLPLQPIILTQHLQSGILRPRPDRTLKAVFLDVYKPGLDHFLFRFVDDA